MNRVYYMIGSVRFAHWEGLSDPHSPDLSVRHAIGGSEVSSTNPIPILPALVGAGPVLATPVQGGQREECSSQAYCCTTHPVLGGCGRGVPSMFGRFRLPRQGGEVRGVS